MDYKQYYRYYSRLEPIIKQPEVKAYTMLSLTIMAIAVFGFLAIKPGIENVAVTAREIKDNREMYNLLKDKITALQQGIENYDQNVKPKEDSVLYPAFPTRPEFNTLLSKLEEAASKANVAILSLQFQPVDLTESGTTTQPGTQMPQPKRSTKSYNTVDFDMTITGDYTKLNSYLNYLYKLNRIVVIQSVQIIRPDKEKDQKINIGEYNFIIKAQAFYQK